MDRRKLKPVIKRDVLGIAQSFFDALAGLYVRIDFFPHRFGFHAKIKFVWRDFFGKFIPYRLVNFFAYKSQVAHFGSGRN